MLGPERSWATRPWAAVDVTWLIRAWRGDGVAASRASAFSTAGWLTAEPPGSEDTGIAGSEPAGGAGEGRASHRH